MLKDDAVWSLIEKAQGELAGAIRRLLNEPPIDEKHLTPEQAQRRVSALRACACQISGGMLPEDRHLEWMKTHEADGWVYGDEFDAAGKRHPNLIPWEQLSRSAKAKIELFGIMASLGAAIIASAGDSQCVSDTSDNPHSDLPKS